jgi:signal transduction histidine kinase
MSLPFIRLLRLTSLLVWAAMLWPVLNGAAHGQDGLTWAKAEIWIPLWLAFGAGVGVGTTSAALPRAARAAAFAVQTAAALAMCGLQPEFYVGFLLVIIAWQLAVYLPVRVAAGWVLAQALGLFIVLSPICANVCGWVASGVYLAFQVFFLATVLLVRREWEARVEQARLNAELTAAQSLLVERTHAHERLRLSRELHDVMGHSLTALSLNLELALNTRDEAEREKSLARAQLLTRELIGDVRDVVGALRTSERLDVAHALEVLAGSATELKVHLTTPLGLTLEDPERAHALLRCVQEAITNTRKHARAENLWIEVREEAGTLVVDVRDDGRGASAGGEPGFGLAGMRERFARLGGEVRIAPPGGQGFALTARLPMAAA